MGLFCTLQVLVISLVYLSIRLDILVNHGESNVNVVMTKNALPLESVIPLTVGGDSELDFRVRVVYWDLDTNESLDKHRIGTLGFYEVHDYWDFDLEKEVHTERKLNSHVCTREDNDAAHFTDNEDILERWFPLSECLDVGESISLWNKFYDVSSLQIRIDPC